MEQNTRDQINLLESRQLELRAIMQNSDEHALKCYKSGLDFKKEYPEDWNAYNKARLEYNENEVSLAEMTELLEQEEASIEIAEDVIIECEGDM